jgi:ribonuclease HII
LQHKTKQHNSVDDSKKIPEARRTDVVQQLRSDADLRFRVASVAPATIDRIGISRALRLAVGRALNALELAPDEMEVRLDGRLYAPKTYPHQTTIVRGDASEWVIGAASLVAKVHRDAYMVRQAKKFPWYGFERNKGYGTKQHYVALGKHGLSPLHRRGFLTRLR